MITEDKIICKWCGKVRYVARAAADGKGRTLNETCGTCSSEPSPDVVERIRRSQGFGV